MLNNGASALDAAVHAVSRMEDDELFNCGRGSVFTRAGTIEMEASIMVASLTTDSDSSSKNDSAMKCGVGVMMIKNVRNPIKLAREVILRTPYDESGNPIPGIEGGSMHSQLSGPYVEELAKKQNWDLQFMPDEWFWTKRRWDEHRRGLGGTGQEFFSSGDGDGDKKEEEEAVSMSQGTVGCVCLDQWGNLVTATSTGGMTNKWPGRIGDTPTLGTGFWAEDWETNEKQSQTGNAGQEGSVVSFVSDVRSLLGDCLPRVFRSSGYTPLPVEQSQIAYPSEKQPQSQSQGYPPTSSTRRRAAAVSGTGNGDSFLRTAAARTVCAMLRFSSSSLAEAISAVAGPGGELQRSAGQRWGKTGEGEGGMIGIEAELVIGGNGSATEQKERRGKAVFDFNCSGMWRAWMEEDTNGMEHERVMVFREEYQ